jgi:manganese transport protein
MLAFAGPGYLVAVGYMDPGNWATDLAGGSRFGYTLLSVILLSNLMAILLQALALRLGIATGRDLAQACRDHYSRPVSFMLWVLCEIAIAACDLAEVIGSAIALNLLSFCRWRGVRLRRWTSWPSSISSRRDFATSKPL